MVSDLTAVRNNLQAEGLPESNTFTKIDAFGTHSESYWCTQFGALYQWLFANETLALQKNVDRSPRIIQTVSGKILAERLPSATDFYIINITGMTAGKLTLTNGVSQLPADLPKGIYVLKPSEGYKESVKIIKN